jgi:hypothetical protein
MMDNIDPNHAVDLSKAAESADARRRAAEAAQKRADEEYVERWQRAMKKYFRGTGFTPWNRKTFIRAAAKRATRPTE